MNYLHASRVASKAAKDATNLWVTFLSCYQGASDYEVQEHGTMNKRRVTVNADGRPVEGMRAPSEHEARAIAVYCATLEGAQS